MRNHFCLVDAIIAREFKANAENEIVSVDSVTADAMMLDVDQKPIA